MEVQDTMSYFNSKSTWLSLVDTHGFSGQPPFGMSTPDNEGPEWDSVALGQASHTTLQDFTPVLSGTADTEEDLEYLRITLDLRYRLFFQFKEWEFGPSMLEDYLRLAQAQTDTEEALFYYCLARHVAVTLVQKFDQAEFRLAWIEADRVIAEVHALVGNVESCLVYAKEGLEAIKGGKFSSTLDMRITKLAIRFMNLLKTDT